MTQPDRFARMVEDSHFWALTDVDRQEVFALLHRYHARVVRLVQAQPNKLLIADHQYHAGYIAACAHLLTALAALKQGKQKKGKS